MTKDELLKALDEMFLEADDGPRKVALDVAIEVLQQDISDISDFDVDFAYKSIIDNHERGN